MKALDLHDDLVRQCVAGSLAFDQFCELYNDFYAFYALDGHESELDELALFEKHENRIQPHEFIAYEVLARVCSDSDAELESYKLAGRFGSRVATEMLSRVQFSGTAQAEA
nr:hypothetical protein [uncultured Roseateles sp.]